ncbi:hypothetical protein J1N35_040558 [Gossypium stocksii]|uniref:Uncharacterized protein n=1 Tax=Gossypium stocksii TaxID=47602 RepID=A0A9D3ZHV2_9ROSI|nr:hypothetical protein J1N35_040558 [Gossypium stocksii]
MQSFQDYLPDLMSNFLLHAEVVDNPLDACRVNFNAFSNLTGAHLDFYVHFPFEPAWEEFVGKWKISRKLYFAKDPTKICVAPTARGEGDENKGENEEEDEVLADP